MLTFPKHFPVEAVDAFECCAEILASLHEPYEKWGAIGHTDRYGDDVYALSGSVPAPRAEYAVQRLETVIDEEGIDADVTTSPDLADASRAYVHVEISVCGHVEIDGERVEAPTVRDIGDGYGGVEIADGRREWVLYPDTESAGKAARDYWRDMAECDPSEFACIVGESTLISWGLGQYDGPGTTKVRSLADWLDLWLDTPEEHFASYDGAEADFVASPAMADEIGMSSGVAYRRN